MRNIRSLLVLTLLAPLGCDLTYTPDAALPQTGDAQPEKPKKSKKRNPDRPRLPSECLDDESTDEACAGDEAPLVPAGD